MYCKDMQFEGKSTFTIMTYVLYGYAVWGKSTFTIMAYVL